MFPSYLRTADLGRHAQNVTWLWHGLIALGQITLFTSQWKLGKTTLIGLLLSRRAQGGRLAGLDVAAGGSAILTEESATLWNLRHERVDLGPGVAFFCRPFHGRPSLDAFREFLAGLVQRKAEMGCDLLVIDPLAYFLPAPDENLPGPLLAALEPLRDLANEGFGILIAHHPRKGKVLEGQSPRGSGVLPAFADILVEMAPYAPGDPSNRRRRLTASSRFDATPRSLLLELNDLANDYHVLAAGDLDDFPAGWPILLGIFEDAKCPLNRLQVQEDWPSDHPAPPCTTLYRWLEHAVERQLLVREGAGRKTNPFTYYLPGKMELWKDDLFYKLHQIRQTPILPPRVFEAREEKRRGRGIR